MTVDSEDMRPFSPMPEEYFSPFAWDAADNTMFRPLVELFAVNTPAEAVNVNAMDEVPDSSWFTNRLSRAPMNVEDIVKAECSGPTLDPAGPWTIVSAKPDGANPGFIIEDDQGVRYLLKFDAKNQAERATAADIIGSIIYWSAGYYTPCNRMVFFNRDVLKIGENATAKRFGEKIPLTWDMLEVVFEFAYRRKDGLIRAAASRFLPGIPLGPWRYEQTKRDDPNDVIPHQERRELRGAYVLASWINHFDSREMNTLQMWIQSGPEGHGYVRHNYIDFGDSFGSMWMSIVGMSERLGHSNYLDMPFLFQDLVTFGAIPRVWRKNTLGPSGEVFGYFNVWTFKPDQYRPGYPNPAFSRATERDKAWMARIIADFTPEAIEGAVAEGKFENEVSHRELIRILKGRRELILKRWFRNLSPLTQPKLEATADGVDLCLRDLAVTSGIISRRERIYWHRAWEYRGGRRLNEIKLGDQHKRGSAHVCVGLPDVKGASLEKPGYLIVDVAGLYSPSDKKSRPARVHLYQLGSTQYKIVGLQRPYDLKPPHRLD